MPRIFLLLFLGGCFILTSCSNKQYQTLFQQKNSLTDTSTRNDERNAGLYCIRPQDLLQIRNLQNNKDIVDLSPSVTGVQASFTPNTQQQASSYLVEDDGTVALTGLGRVAVAGLTRVEAQKKIEDLYHKDLLKNPIIEVKITNLAVTFFGEVHTPGNQPLIKDRTSLVQMIGAAGGLTDKANEKNIKIIRGSEKNPQVIEVDLTDISSINDPRCILQNGDIIYVSENRRAIRNDNFQNFSSIIQPGILVINTLLVILALSRR